MKNRLLNILLVTLALCFALQSCGLEEMHDTQNGAESGVIEFVARQISYDKMNVGTKATSSEIAAWENNIYTAFFMVFDNSGNRVLFRNLSPESGHLSSIESQTIMSNKALTSATVCYVINIPIETAGGLDTYTKLQNLRLPIEYAPVASTGCVGVPVLKKTSTATGVYALPMIGIKTGCDLSAPTSDFTRNPIILERIFAKVDVKLSVAENITFNMTDYVVNNIPNKVALCPSTTGTTPYSTSSNPGDFLANENGMTSFNVGSITNNIVANGTDRTFFFYVPEHMLGPVTNANYPNPTQSVKPLLLEGSGKKAVYIEINAGLSLTDGSGNITKYTGKYNIYLGKDEVSNFDLERNTYYKNTLLINGATPSDTEHRVNLLEGGTYTNLVANEAANCYIITEAGKYILPAYKGATKSLTGAEMCYGKPVVVWSDLDDDALVFENSNTNDSKIVFEIKSGKFKAGNALIAIVDDKNTSNENDDEILWSWHLWCCTDDPRENLDRYPDDNDQMVASIMNRNLGAKSPLGMDQIFDNTISSAINGAINGFLDGFLWKDGLYYQWGRKDPFRGEQNSYSTASVDYATTTKNPNILYSKWDATGAGWDNNKTKDDPCPAGYKVPSNNIWKSKNNDAAGVDIGLTNIKTTTTTAYTYNLQITTGDANPSPYIFYPYTGYIDATSGQLITYTSTTDYKTTEKDSFAGIEFWVDCECDIETYYGAFRSQTKTMSYSYETYAIKENQGVVHYYQSKYIQGSLDLSKLNSSSIGRRIAERVSSLISRTALDPKYEYSNEWEISHSDASPIRCVVDD